MRPSPARQRLGLHFATHPDRYITAEETAEFLRGLLRRLRGRVIVVWDGGSNHQGEPIRQLLRRHSRLSLERLPAYAPQLNPVEALWAYLKYGQLANFVPKGVDHLDDIVVEHLLNTQLQPKLLKSIWKGSELPLPTRCSGPSGQ